PFGHGHHKVKWGKELWMSSHDEKRAGGRVRPPLPQSIFTVQLTSRHLDRRQVSSHHGASCEVTWARAPILSISGDEKSPRAHHPWASSLASRSWRSMPEQELLRVDQCPVHVLPGAAFVGGQGRLEVHVLAAAVDRDDDRGAGRFFRQ